MESSRKKAAPSQAVLGNARLEFTEEVSLLAVVEAGQPLNNIKPEHSGEHCLNSADQLKLVGAVLPPDFSAMPAELRERSRWVVWKGAKVPYNASMSNSKASVIDPETWGTFDQAQTAYEEGGYSGVGFVLNGDGIVGVDLDQCFCGDQPKPEALKLLERIGCKYVEVSPSGRGLRGFGRGEAIKGVHGVVDGVKIELYAAGRYLTVTGTPLLSGPLVYLPGFSEVAHAIRLAPLQKRTEEIHRRTEEDLGNLLSSSVGFPAHTIPEQEGQRNSCLFALARYLKGKHPNATRAELREFVLQWHQTFLPVIGTKDFTVTMADFMHAWEKVQQPYGATLAAIINGMDQDASLPDGIQKLGYGGRGIYLVRVCMALQAHHNADPFFVSVRQAGELLGVHYTEAAKMLSVLVADEVLSLLSKGSGNVASRYRFIWEKT